MCGGRRVGSTRRQFAHGAQSVREQMWQGPSPVRVQMRAAVPAARNRTPDARIVPKEQLDELLVRHARLPKGVSGYYLSSTGYSARGPTVNEDTSSTGCY